MSILVQRKKGADYIQEPEPKDVWIGATWIKPNTGELFVYTKNGWRSVIYTNKCIYTNVGDRGVFAGGFGATSYSNTIDYITISIWGNAQDFGDLTVARGNVLAATSNGANDRGVFGGGANDSGSFNVIDYITISTPGNAQNFGDLSITKEFLSATSNGVNNRGVFGGGYNNAQGMVNTIDYITISTPGNAQDFGDLTITKDSLAATSNATNERGVFGGGEDSNGKISIIDYITISTLGNAQNFGDLTIGRFYLSATSNSINDIGVFGGGNDGSSSSNTIDYINISSKSDAQDFGDLSIIKESMSATSNGINDRGVFGGGSSGGGSYLNTIDYVLISTPENAIDFGDLTITRDGLSATSNA